MPNSSAPRRATEPCPAAVAASRWPTAVSTWSPVSWPIVSLTMRKSSMLTSSTPAVRPVAWTAGIAARTVCWKRSRLPRPVSGSRYATSSSSRSRRRRSVTSRSVSTRPATVGSSERSRTVTSTSASSPSARCARYSVPSPGPDSAAAGSISTPSGRPTTVSPRNSCCADGLAYSMRSSGQTMRMTSVALSTRVRKYASLSRRTISRFRAMWSIMLAACPATTRTDSCSLTRAISSAATYSSPTRLVPTAIGPCNARSKSPACAATAGSRSPTSRMRTASPAGSAGSPSCTISTVRCSTPGPSRAATADRTTHSTRATSVATSRASQARRSSRSRATVCRRPAATTDMRASDSSINAAEPTAISAPSSTGPVRDSKNNTVGATSDATPIRTRPVRNSAGRVTTRGSVSSAIDGWIAASPPAMKKRNQPTSIGPPMLHCPPSWLRPYRMSEARRAAPDNSSSRALQPRRSPSARRTRMATMSTSNSG